MLQVSLPVYSLRLQHVHTVVNFICGYVAMLHGNRKTLASSTQYMVVVTKLLTAVVAFGNTKPNLPSIITLFDCFGCLDFRINDILWIYIYIYIYTYKMYIFIFVFCVCVCVGYKVIFSNISEVP
jgi:hypothetical protein